MKTYKQFVEGCGCAHKKKKKTENVTEVVALAPLAIPVGKAIGAGLAATGLTGMIMQARKQGEGKRSQPVDYGQGGTATPRGKSVQRGRLNSNDAYNRAKKEERKKEAQRRARERAEQGIDELIGSEEERRYAKQRRDENNKKRQERNLDNLVDKAARELGVKLPEEVQSEGAALAIKAGSSLIPKIVTGIGAVGTVLQASKADKERRRQLAKDNNLDITKPGDRAKLGRLLKKDTEAKKRAEKGDTRSQEQYRQEKAENRKTIDATRQQMGQSKAQPGTKKRAEIDKNLKDFRDELRDVTNDPIVPSRAKVRVKVGQEVPKPNDTLPKRTGASPQKVRDRRSYEAQQRRNRKQDIPEGMLPVPSDKRKRIINPMIAAMPPKTTDGVNKAMKKGLDDLNTKYQRLYDMLNSVPKDRGKA